jgi:hypothetical protein
LPGFATLPVLQGIGIPFCCELPNECINFLLVHTPQRWLKDLAGKTGFVCVEKKNHIGQRPVIKLSPAAVIWYA